MFIINKAQGENMKSNKIIKVINYCLVGIYLLLFVIGILVPLLSFKINNGGTSTVNNVYFFDLFAGLTSSGSTSSFTPTYFQGALIISICIMGALFILFENKILKIVGSSFLLTSFGFTSYIFNSVKTSKYLIVKGAGTSLESISMAGAVLLLIAGIIGLLISLLPLIEAILPIVSKLFKPRMSLEEKLNEIESLKEKGLISEEEATSLRKEALK